MNHARPLFGNLSRVIGTSFTTRLRFNARPLTTITSTTKTTASSRLLKNTTLLTRNLSAISSPLHSRYEPPYLDEITYEPRYQVIQLHLQGHDFAVLEQYRKLALQFAPVFSLNVVDSYPMPTRQTKISHFDPLENGKEGAKVIEEFVLDTFERVIEMRDADAKILPVFMEFLRNHQPEGVRLSAELPDPKLENFRYIPDMEMTVLQRKLDDLESGKIDSLTWKQ